MYLITEAIYTEMTFKLQVSLFDEAKGRLSETNSSVCMLEGHELSWGG